MKQKAAQGPEAEIELEFVEAPEPTTVPDSMWHRWLGDHMCSFVRQGDEILCVMTVDRDGKPLWALKVTAPLADFVVRHPEFFKEILEQEPNWRKD